MTPPRPDLRSVRVRIFADGAGCHVITVTQDLLKKLALAGKNAAEFSLERVKTFQDDAKGAGYSL